jgi:deoxyribodipyrimidine photo-lyase
MSKRAIYWLTTDLRLDDNPALMRAASGADELAIVFAPGNAWLSSDWIEDAASMMRWQFLRECLTDLDIALRKLGQRLVLSSQAADIALPAWIEQFKPHYVFASVQTGWYEQRLWETLVERYPQVQFASVHAQTIFDESDLPFACDANGIPRTFSAFRRQVEKLPVPAVQPVPQRVPPPASLTGELPASIGVRSTASTESEPTPAFRGGETDAPSRYKQVRNALDGWENSTKFSAWLASGNLSARRIMQRLRQYEADAGANDSTYWIFFELLWREYFQWYARAYGRNLFLLKGIHDALPVQGRNAKRLAQWQSGCTEYPIINACMKQLAITGYMSNRGRQLAASCFVNELGLDWRLGAAWFEHHLLDFDVASNWGNWQYLAGVGADPRGKRRFDLKKQAELYDPGGAFTVRWT